ncbi:hypothetical protein FRC02_006425 [Tulasnella sp. 418]|nr:hypothetical protein FRC02_006425 [Tulasnella sp. 418]
MAVRRSARARQPMDEPTPHVDLEYPSSVPTFTVNPTQLSGSSSSSGPLPWFSAFGRKDANAPLPEEADPKYSDPLYYTSNSYGKSGRNSSHTAKKPEGHIKRPPNCFLLFRSHVKESGIRIPEALKPILKERLKEKRREQRAKKGGNGDEDDEDDDEDDEDDNDDDEQSVSKISGILWDFLPAAEKSLFRARAAHAKEMHKKLYPHYKYSPQVKDKSVKRRVGKKMPAEKKERLEQVAEVLVQGMGWSTEGDPVSKHKKSNSSPTTRNGTPSAQFQQPQDESVPGVSSFSLSAYNHQQPRHPFHQTHNATLPHTAPAYPYPGYQQQPSTSYHFGVRDDGSGTMNPAIQSAHAVNGVHPTMSTPPPQAPPYMPTLEMGFDQPPPRMYRRTSSCPPPGAHLTWNDTAHSFHPPQPPTQPQFQPPQPSQTHPSHFVPPNHTFVRPGGKTARKLRTGTSVKQQILNGSKRAGSSKPSSAQGRPATPSGGMTLPSLPAVMGRVAGDTGMVNGVPMSAGGGFEDPSSFQHQHAAWAHYDLGNSTSASATSSPATFSTVETPSSARGGIMLFPQQSQQQPYTFPQQGGQQPNFAGYTTSVDPYTPTTVTAEEFAKTPQQEGAEGSHLGLTMIEENYTFPPPGPRSPKRAASPAKNLGVAVPRQQQQQENGGYPASPANGAASIVSPTPVTPISMQSMQQQPPAPRGIDDLGVELNLDHGVMSGLGGLLEFSFPPTSTSPHGHSMYSYGGAGVGDVLLSDVSLGIDQDREGERPTEGGEKKVGGMGMGIGGGWRNQQPLVPGGPIPANGGGMGPLDIPLHELFHAGAEFDAAGYMIGEEMSSSEQLEYEMMEWRRNSETLNQQQQQQQPVSPHQTAPPSPYKFGTPVPAEEPYMGRRASIALSQTLGGEMAMALYGFDAATAGQQDWTGMEYETNGAPAAPHQYNGGAYGYAQQLQHHQPPLGTVVEERGSSEEAPNRPPHRSVPVEVGWR